MFDCSDGNHVIGCGYNEGTCNMYEYIETKRKHPGMIFSFCPACGIRLEFIDDLADAYQKFLFQDARQKEEIEEAWLDEI